MATTEQHDTNQYLTFLAGDERLAINILEVKEILELEYMTRVPMTPPFIRGVINLRGNVVPVIDLSTRLGRNKSEIGKKSCIVLVEINTTNMNHTVGMLVDEVREILEIDPAHTQPPPNFGGEIHTDFIKAMGRIDEQFIILLNVSHVLTVEDLSTIKQLSNMDPASIQDANPKQ